MKTLIDLTNLTPHALLFHNGTVIVDDGTYYNLPQWFKTTFDSNKLEVLMESDLPVAIQNRIESVQIRKCLERFVHLHGCEQEGIGSGQPSAKEWLGCFDEAVIALKQ